MPKRKLLILITNHFAVLNLVHTGFLAKIAKHYSVSIISDIIGSAELKLINDYFNCSLKLLTAPVPAETRLLHFLRLIQKALFFILFDTYTRKVKLLQLNPSTRLLIYFLEKIPFTSRLFRVMLTKIRTCIISISSYRFKIDARDLSCFDAILSSSPLDIRENIIINSLVRCNAMPTIGVVISWDNLTSKGLINSNFDHLMVWNEQMAGEFEKLYSCCGVKPKIHITGVPRFDTYFEKRQGASSIRQKIILFASSAPKHFPGQCQIVDDLLEYIQRNDDILLLVRCHPADNPSVYNQYKTEKNVVIWPPATPGFWKGISDFPPLDFLKGLSDMMYSCDVCVQVASTMRLDAAACNKPIISIAYDGKYKMPYKRSVRRLYSYSHQIPLNFLRLDYPVFSKEELFCFLDKVLAESYSAPDQRPALRKFVHYTEPRSVDSMVQYVREWLG